ncbi:MFS general substrate transporter [Aspergillus sclerotioniger CBS 115572]|uniref:MFS general substrate transporter n=1 Tax=Aspergillus sclerotioniger CBS 115572 TaxID=1450535 RepID=A0A317WVK5_9EURO|nr:MFS general substrate transporter [Aspergillus sclerotioniger CBS 115572]PWY90389.1 MFS general substrate transporter [Aspergillus sclerotioniger CBS 115572]
MSPMFPYFAQEFHLDDTQLLLLTGVCILTFAYANFIAVPCSNIFGRRMTYFIFTVISIASYIWQARATSYTSLIVARVLNGFGAAINETMPVQIIADLFFLHERGRWMMAYFSTTSLGGYLGPVISGNITQRFGWRSFFWLSMALTCFNFLTHIPKTPSPIPIPNPHPNHEHGRPSRPQFHLYHTPDPNWKSLLLRAILTPIRITLYPLILWTALTASGPGNIVLLYNLTESSVLASPPYNFTASQVGYSNFSFVIGVLLGLITAGPLSDLTAMHLTTRNNNIYEAEMRLLSLLPFVLLLLISVLVGAFAITNLWPWPIILTIGYGFSGLFSAAIASIAVAYAVDCYKPISGEIMVVVTVVRNTCGFSMSYWVPGLAGRSGLGFLAPALVQLGVTVGPLVLGVGVWGFGKRLRGWTRGSWVHFLGE